MRRRLLTGLQLLVAATIAAPAAAHKPSDSYLRLSVQADTLSGRWDIAVRDLHELLDLDADGNLDYLAALGTSGTVRIELGRRDTVFAGGLVTFATGLLAARAVDVVCSNVRMRS